MKTVFVLSVVIFGTIAYKLISASRENLVESNAKYEVIIKKTGSNRVGVIKIVREITGMGLKEATELVESAPVVIKKGITLDEANKIKSDLSDLGAEITIQKDLDEV